MIRRIDDERLSESEAVRATGDFATALKLAQAALQLDKEQFTPVEVREIAQSEEDTTLLATGARLIFSSRTSLMKRSFSLNQVDSHARATLEEVGKPVYQNDSFRNAAKSLVHDIHGSPYSYDFEFARDVADFLATLAIIYPGKKGQRLQQQASEIWNLLLESLENASTVDQCFFYLEKCWFLFKTGRKKEIDPAELAKNFSFYIHEAGVINRDRMITITSRAWVMAEAVGSSELMDETTAILNNNTTIRRSADSHVSKEKVKLMVDRLRKIVFHVFVPFTGSKAERLHLYVDAQELGQYQKQRLTNDK